MSGESRVSRENEVFEDAGGPAAGDAAALGKPSPADAIPEPVDPHATGEDAYPPGEEVDETVAGGLRHPDGTKERDA